MKAVSVSKPNAMLQRRLVSELNDNAVLAVVVTAFLIREGGSIRFTASEWDAAIEHEGSLYIHRDEPQEPMLVALMTRSAGQQA